MNSEKKAKLLLFIPILITLVGIVIDVSLVHEWNTLDSLIIIMITMVTDNNDNNNDDNDTNTSNTSRNSN
jgi:hypothetical protein